MDEKLINKIIKAIYPSTDTNDKGKCPKNIMDNKTKYYIERMEIDNLIYKMIYTKDQTKEEKEEKIKKIRGRLMRIVESENRTDYKQCFEHFYGRDSSYVFKEEYRKFCEDRRYIEEIEDIILTLDKMMH